MLKDSGRSLGILIFFGVPAIIGGGIVYDIFGNYTAVIIYEILMLFVAGGCAVRA
jgi:hypothetical protein